MTQKQFSSLSDQDSKILFYFYLILNGDFPYFDLKFLRDSVELDNINLFKHWKYLANINLLDIIIEEKEAKLYLKVFNGTIDLRIVQWSIPTIVIFNEIIYQNHPEYMPLLVNYIYSPLGLYDSDTMNQWLDVRITPKIKSASEVMDTFTEEKNKDKKLRAVYRKEREKRAKYLTKVFYEILNQKVKIFLTKQLLENETKEMVEFLKRYPEIPNELITEGINFLRTDEYWEKIIVSVGGLTKHFSKFLSGSKGIVKKQNKMRLA